MVRAGLEIYFQGDVPLEDCLCKIVVGLVAQKKAIEQEFLKASLNQRTVYIKDQRIVSAEEIMDQLQK